MRVQTELILLRKIPVTGCSEHKEFLGYIKDEFLDQQSNY
jgi:hypothetical protein